jgi:hypothetical protein
MFEFMIGQGVPEDPLLILFQECQRTGANLLLRLQHYIGVVVFFCYGSVY